MDSEIKHVNVAFPSSFIDNLVEDIYYIILYMVIDIAVWTIINL